MNVFDKVQSMIVIDYFNSIINHFLNLISLSLSLYIYIYIYIYIPHW